MAKRQQQTAAAEGITNTRCSGVASSAHDHSQSQELEVPLQRDARSSALLEKGPREPSELCVGKTNDESAAEEGVLQTPIPAVGQAAGALVTGRWLLILNTSYTVK